MTTESAAEAAPEVVADAGPLIHLDELACLDLLDDFPLVAVPEQVWHEVSVHRPGVLSDPPGSWLRREVEIPSDKGFQTLVKSFALDLGEQAAISLLPQYPRSVFLTDDTAARLAAKTLGYRAHGTLGIVLRAIRRLQRTKDDVLHLLRNLPQFSTLHLRDELREDIIRSVKTESYRSF